MKKTRRKEEATSIAWGWVMETLADSKQVDTPLIDDLLSKVPHGSDSLSTTAKERLALRRLDELFASTSNANSTKRKSASDSLVINGSESAQDVYRRLVSITKASSSRASILDSFKLDVHKFTLQKRACLPKCALQLMEEVLTEGGHPCTSVLRGISEDVVKKLDQVRNVIRAQSQELNSLPVPENQDKALQEDIRDRPSSSTRKKGKRVHFAVESRTLHYADDLVNDIEHRTDVGEVHPTHEIASSSAPDIQTEDLRVGHANDAVASYKRTRSEFTKQQHTHVKDSGRMESTEHISDPMSACESSKSPNDNASSFDHNKAMNPAQGILVGGLQDDVDFVDGDVGDSDHVTKRMKMSTNEIDHHQPGFVCGTNCVHQEEPQDALHQTELEAPRDNVETFGQGTQVQNLQEDVAHVDNDLGKGTQAHQEAPGNALFVDSSRTEVEAESPQSYVNRSGKGAQVQDLVEDVVVVDDDIGDGERASKRRKVDANLTNRDRPGFIGSNSNIHKKAPLFGPHGYDNQTELESSRGNVEHSARISLDSTTNMTDARLTLNQDSIGTDWAEDKACLKCNRGGQLLICSASTCFIAVHESCLGSPVSLDHASNFYCPFCVYSQANIACQELARKLSDAKQNVRLTKDRLVQFMQNEAST